MNSKDKAQAVVEMFKRGMLCNCNKTETVLNGLTEAPETEIVHEPNCIGRIKCMELLHGDMNEN